ncbi:sensor domain-containing diguanylate cyclase [Mycobacterium sp. C31M]
MRLLNTAWQKLAGPSAVAGLADLVTAEDHPHVLAQIGSGSRLADIRQMECRLRCDGGDARWFLLTFAPATDNPDDGVVCTAADIHDLKHRELTLERLVRLQERMLDSSADCIKVISPDGHLLHMNETGCQSLGVARNSVYGRDWLSLLPADVQAAAHAALEQAAAGHSARFAGKSDSQRGIQHWDNLLSPVAGTDGQTSSILCVSRDVTAEQAAQEQLRQSRLRLAMAAHVGGLGIWDYDIDRDEMVCDENWYRIVGLDPARTIRSVADFRPFIHPEDVERATEVRQTASDLVASGRDYAISYRIVRPDGETRWVRSAACLVNGSGPDAQRAVGFIVDVTAARMAELALREANRELQEATVSLTLQTELDPLTGVANKRRLDRDLARLCADAVETGRPLTICMVDVDHFKAFNDRYGHVEGDAALRKVAVVLQACVRADDLVARFGGEEFVLLLPDIRDPTPFLRRIRQAIGDLAVPHFGSPLGRLTVSQGGATLWPTGPMTPESLLAACDEALYEAKATGRDRYIVRR